jgi:ribosomal protein S18 acetylase RimI-like enzyme
VISGERYSKLAYVKDVLVGAISTKTDHKEDGTVEVYIMTVTVLKPYRRYGIASQLLQQSIKDCCESNHVDKMVLHVQSNNESA